MLVEMRLKWPWKLFLLFDPALASNAEMAPAGKNPSW